MTPWNRQTSLPTTRLSDVKEVLRVATERVQARLAGK